MKNKGSNDLGTARLAVRVHQSSNEGTATKWTQHQRCSLSNELAWPVKCLKHCSHDLRPHTLQGHKKLIPV
jgi:hypothetical protein